MVVLPLENQSSSMSSFKCQTTAEKGDQLRKQSWILLGQWGKEKKDWAKIATSCFQTGVALPLRQAEHAAKGFKMPLQVSDISVLILTYQIGKSYQSKSFQLKQKYLFFKVGPERSSNRCLHCQSKMTRANTRASYKIPLSLYYICLFDWNWSSEGTVNQFFLAPQTMISTVDRQDTNLIFNSRGLN